MKKSLILSVAAAALSFPVFGGDFSWNGFRYDAEKIALKNAENNNFGMLQILPESKKELVKISFENGKMTIDAREFFRETKTGEEITLRLPVSGMIRGKKARLMVEMSATPDTEFEFYFEGGEDLNGKHNHFWRCKRFIAKAAPEKFVYDEQLSQTQKDVCLRLTFRKPGAFTIGTYEFVPEVR